jgi:hypothetical protein
LDALLLTLYVVWTLSDRPNQGFSGCQHQSLRHIDPKLLNSSLIALHYNLKIAPNSPDASHSGRRTFLKNQVCGPKSTSNPLFLLKFFSSSFMFRPGSWHMWRIH